MVRPVRFLSENMCRHLLSVPVQLCVCTRTTGLQFDLGYHPCAVQSSYYFVQSVLRQGHYPVVDGGSYVVDGPLRL